MYVFKVPLCLGLIVFPPAVHGDELDVTESTLEGFEYQTLIAKLDYLQHKFTEMDFAIKDERKAIDEKLEHQKNVSEWILSIMNQQSQTLRHNLSEVTGAISTLNQRMVSNFMALHIQSNEILTVQIANANYERLRKDVQMLLSNQDLAQFMISSGFNLRSVSFQSCKKTPSKRSGKYLMQPTENDEPFIGYCEQTSFGGWLVFQYRFNGSLDFYRDWAENRDGFGIVDGEFWLGLEHLHRITRARKHELLVELKDFDGNYVYARYGEFEIGSGVGQYQLNKLGTYTGTAGDSLTYHKGMDRDNDNISGNCATSWQGAWWYGNCYNSNLNGVYMNSTDAKSMNWYDYKSTFMGLAYSRILIREK
uniref:Fibrinogen C-terminal domain-containing protein n=1 Tax=Anopheles coluzzii TaxID=1518534 RepID=A0A6E8W2B4_ANOCL